MPDERFELQPELTGIGLAYRNKKLIADEIFPTVQVTGESFTYRKYDKSSFLTVPNTRIGEKGEAPEIEIQSKKLTETCENYSVKEKIPQSKIESSSNSPEKIDIQSVTAMQIADVLKISREVNLAAKLGNKANYEGNFKTLAANQKINKSDVNAVDLIYEGLDKVFYKPNTMVISRLAMSALRRNPYVVSACSQNDVKAGVASLEGMKNLFELDKILVGESVVNSAKKGQNPVFAACWGNNISFMYLDPVATTDYGITFGYKAQFNDLTIGSYFDPDAGLKGCQVLRGYQSYVDLITAPECGYLFENVL